MADFDTIKQEINVNIPDNNSQYITAKKVRDTLLDMIDDVDEAKQDTLVSGTNIKTINGYTLLGSGNIVIEDGGDLSAYVSKEELSQMGYVTSTYLSQAGYVTNEYLSQAGYVTSSDLSQASYVTQTELSNAGYLTSVPSEYITESELSGMGYITMGDVSACGYITQTELSNMSYATTSQLSSKQDALVSGTNIKTINNESLLGSGNIVIEGGGDLSAYVSKEELSNMGYVTNTALTNMSYATTSDLNNAISGIDIPTYTSDLTNDSGFITASDLSGYATETYVADYVATHSGPIDLSAYVTYDWLEAQSYVTEQALSTASYVTESQLQQAGYVTQNDLTQAGYVTKSDLSNMSYVTQSALNNASYVTESQLTAMSYITETELGTELNNYVSKTELSNAGYITTSDVSQMGYITASDLPDMSSYATLTYLETYYATLQNVSDTADAMQQVLIDANVLVADPETGDWTTQVMASETYVADYVSEHAPSPDMSAYVTKTELSNAGYITTSDVSQMGYVTGSDLSQASYVTSSDLSNMGYLTAIPSEYVTESELSAKGYITSIPSEYVTQSELSGMSYATTSQLATKQDTLVSGTNIKTVNNNSLLGSGNISITSSGNLISEVTQAEYDAMEQAGTLDPDTIYVITDATPTDLSYYAELTYVETYYVAKTSFIYNSSTNTLTISI